MKKFACLLLICAMTLGLTARAEGEAAPNWYEVFVRSYRDSDGDGLGDLNGLAEKLDYIHDMGWRGLWLMPVMPSPSYHKYDVTDYLAVDPEYGTLDDMAALTAACHERGIRLIVDLPVNHTSTLHPWFTAACDALRSGDAQGEYVDYYNFSREGGTGYTPLAGTDWYYEERFQGGGMPDLNLDNPAVMAEIRRIFDFWLNEVGVDGFRLDAVTSYFTGDEKRNVALLTELKAMAEALKPGSFLVGECWANLNTIAAYYESGVDSFFLFPSAQAEGFIAASMRSRKNPAEKFAAGYQKVLDAIPEGFLTPFLCNHDTGRTVGLVQGRSNPEAVKFAQGLLGMLKGGVFTYYGDEVGLTGSGEDPNKRLAMPWDDGEMTLQPPGTTSVEYPYPAVNTQLEDPDSILNYVRAVNAVRLAHPAISEGENAFLLAEGDVCLMRRQAAGEACLIAVNFSKKEARAFELEPCALAADLEAGGGAATLENTNGGARLLLPPCGIAVLTCEN